MLEAGGCTGTVGQAGIDGEGTPLELGIGGDGIMLELCGDGITLELCGEGITLELGGEGITLELEGWGPSITFTSTASGVTMTPEAISIWKGRALPTVFMEILDMAAAAVTASGTLALVVRLEICTVVNKAVPLSMAI